LEPIKSAPTCFIPALFAHANGDDFIDPSHSKNISDKYAGDYNLITFDGDHITHRPNFFYDSVCIFFNNNLNIASDFGEDNPYIEEELNGEELAQLQTRISYSDQMSRARELSLHEAYVDDDEESLQLALKLSLIDTQAQPPADSSPTSDPKSNDTKPELKDKQDKKDKKKPKDKKDSSKDKKKK